MSTRAEKSQHDFRAASLGLDAAAADVNGSVTCMASVDVIGSADIRL
jgi:hypothetical protein